MFIVCRFGREVSVADGLGGWDEGVGGLSAVNKTGLLLDAGKRRPNGSRWTVEGGIRCVWSRGKINRGCLDDLFDGLNTVN